MQRVACGALFFCGGRGDLGGMRRGKHRAVAKELDAEVSLRGVVCQAFERFDFGGIEFGSVAVNAVDGERRQVVALENRNCERRAWAAGFELLRDMRTQV